ncbi:unnamed protein product [Allacma fusca]|uniref:Protein kinase domain-containing protein n=1 Tax=Allacma fusca TaxID=39272 RepID=A0A8J2L4P8_9HEXA|nr:unnamed protein product [Allacma fusca]
MDSLFTDKTSILGKGAFGLVVRGKYLGDPVAVKTTLPNAEVSYFKALLSELKVMAYIGSHPNVVHFIGAVTNRIKERIVYVIVELSPLGNLESFLKSHRTTYVNFVVNNKIVKTELPYVNVIKRVTTLDFVNWCHQIASGMEYLSKKKVLMKL